MLAEEAAQLGLVNAVCARGAPGARRRYARELDRLGGASSLRETKRQIYSDLHRDVGSAVERSEALIRTMMREPDYREGVAAWVEKRPPRW